MEDQMRARRLARLETMESGAAPTAPPQADLRRVVNVRDYPGRPPANVAYIGRRSVSDTGPYGNPFAMQGEADRGRVCDAFDAELMERMQDPAYVARMMRDLDGKHLGCFCKKPGREVRCHGDSLLREVGKRSRFPALYGR